MSITEGDRHYSRKGGHKYRGDFFKAQEAFRRITKDPTASLKAMLRISPEVPLSEVDWNRRRFMQRSPRNEKK